MTDHNDKDHPETDGALKGVDPEKRRTLTKLAASAFVAPVIASFPMDGLTISRAHAGTASGSGVVDKKRRRNPCRGPNQPEFCNTTILDDLS